MENQKAFLSLPKELQISFLSFKTQRSLVQIQVGMTFIASFLMKTLHTMWDLCTIDWPKEDAANFESQNFEGP